MGRSGVALPILACRAHDDYSATGQVQGMVVVGKMEWRLPAWNTAGILRMSDSPTESHVEPGGC